MTTDLGMLVASAVLAWTLLMASATPTLLAHPLWALGARDEPIDPPKRLQARTKRATANLVENLPLFAVLVLVVHAAGKADATSATGAQVFFGARVVHAILYVAGVPFLRTVIWAASIAGLGMVGSVLL